MVVEGGMGVVTQQLATKAMTAGAAIHTATPVKRVEVQDGCATGVCAIVRLLCGLLGGGGGAFNLGSGKRCSARMCFWMGRAAVGYDKPV
jgi:hypothetical protein